MNDQSFLHIALIYFVIINVVTFFVYGIDKAASKRGQSQTRLSSAEREQARPKVKWKAKKSKWRVSEATLLGLAVIGGSIGAWLGMNTWHHKTLHRKFRFGVPLILVVQIALFLLCSCRFRKDNKQTSVFILSTSSEVFISSDATSQKSDIR
jgi:uncharacterized membrane protein YsdA (DUF1294 family)